MDSSFPLTAGEAAVPRPAREELLAQQVRIDEEGLKVRGALMLHALSPLSVELRLEEAEGEGPRLARLLGKLLRLSAEGAGNLPIQRLRIESGSVRITPKGKEGEARRLVIPEGSLNQFFLRVAPDGGWRADGASLTLERIPARWGFPLPLTGCGFSDVRLTGRREPGRQRGRLVASDLHCDGARAEGATFSGTEDGTRPGVWRWQGEIPALQLDMAKLRRAAGHDPALAKAMRAALARLGLESWWGMENLRLTDVSLSGEAGAVTAKQAEAVLAGRLTVAGQGEVVIRQGKARRTK
ncbi:MAG: hypothetical protein HQL51_06225 [Magnetococcales bacterium]|nr:hypothetical protein [Magnetococcales bacterium]